MASNNFRNDIVKATLTELVDKGHNVSQIARELSTTNSTVKAKAKKFEVTLNRGPNTMSNLCISCSKFGKARPDWARKNISEGMKPRSEETKNKISASAKETNKVSVKLKEYHKNRKNGHVRKVIDLDSLLSKIRAGLSLPELAEHFNVNACSIKKRIKAYSLPTPRRHNDRLHKDKTWLKPKGKTVRTLSTEAYKMKVSKNKLETLLKAGKSVCQMAEALEVSKETVYRRLNQFGLPTYIHSENSPCSNV